MVSSHPENDSVLAAQKAEEAARRYAESNPRLLSMQHEIFAYLMDLNSKNEYRALQCACEENEIELPDDVDPKEIFGIVCEKIFEIKELPRLRQLLTSVAKVNQEFQRTVTHIEQSLRDEFRLVISREVAKQTAIEAAGLSGTLRETYLEEIKKSLSEKLGEKRRELIHLLQEIDLVFDYIHITLSEMELDSEISTATERLIQAYQARIHDRDDEFDVVELKILLEELETVRHEIEHFLDVQKFHREEAKEENYPRRIGKLYMQSVERYFSSMPRYLPPLSRRELEKRAHTLRDMHKTMVHLKDYLAEQERVEQLIIKLRVRMSILEALIQQ